MTRITARFVAVAATCICIPFAGCGAEAGDARDLYNDNPDEFADLVLPEGHENSPAPEGTPAVFGSSPVDETDNVDETAPPEAGPDEPTGEPDAAPADTGSSVCGDGICGAGEDQSCFVDCTGSDPNQNDEPATPPAGNDEPDAPPAQRERDSGGSGGSGSGNDTTWTCVAQQCAPEWGACNNDPGCSSLHSCMIGCSGPGKSSCQDHCFMMSGPLAAMLLDDVAFCAAVMGCM
ncbi:MAG: hypothetical protein ACI9WU_003530 [Myxococcota bacterium]|jgi:hypothetical protein